MTDNKSNDAIPPDPLELGEIDDPGSKVSEKNYPICGAPRRQGVPGPCTRPAGWGTDHAGEGRCKLHGGGTPITHGRYSTVKRERIRELIEQYEADPNPLDMGGELAACRALFQDFIERYDEYRMALVAWHASYDGDRPTSKPRQILDIADAHKILAEITRIVKRIEDVKAANAISRADFYRVMTEMGRVVDRAVLDGDVRKKIHDGWMEIRLA